VDNLYRAFSFLLALPFSSALFWSLTKKPSGTVIFRYDPALIGAPGMSIIQWKDKVVI
jgi:hypothetical protein